MDGNVGSLEWLPLIEAMMARGAQWMESALSLTFSLKNFVHMRNFAFLFLKKESIILGWFRPFSTWDLKPKRTAPPFRGIKSNHETI